MHRGSHLPFDGMMMTMMMNILFVISQSEELYLYSATGTCGQDPMLLPPPFFLNIDEKKIDVQKNK